MDKVIKNCPEGKMLKEIIFNRCVNIKKEKVKKEPKPKKEKVMKEPKPKKEKVMKEPKPKKEKVMKEPKKQGRPAKLVNNPIMSPFIIPATPAPLPIETPAPIMSNPPQLKKQSRRVIGEV
jgi:hypothetical protein